MRRDLLPRSPLFASVNADNLLQPTVGMLIRNRGIRGSEVFCIPWEGPEVPLPAAELGQPYRNLDTCIGAMKTSGT